MKRRNIIGRIAIMAGMVAAVQFTVQLTATSPAAAALPGLVLAPSGESANNGARVKNATSTCPPFKVVVGGGARISGTNIGQMKLTTLLPVTTASSSYYHVTAQAPTDEYVGNWKVTAYAVCASIDPSEPAYKIERGSSEYGPARFKQTAARCTEGRRAIGAGASISAPTGIVGLQLSRTSDPMDIARATARATVNGNWQVTSHAICIKPPVGQVFYGSGSQTATASCPDDMLVHGAGGGGALTDLGPIFLRVIQPLPGLHQVYVAMNAPYPGGMVAQAVCH
jgi:hypothetical protein